MLQDRILPVEEMLHEDEFTGWVDILRELEEWIEQIGRFGAEAHLNGLTGVNTIGWRTSNL